MPDWRRLVSRRLGRVAIAPGRRDEIVREMAGFLEDLYEERLLGAAGAAWSRREGGNRRERLLVAVFPVLAPWAVLFPVGAARVLSLDIPTSEKLLLLLVSALLNWVVLPAAALFLGALPMLRRSDPPTPAA